MAVNLKSLVSKLNDTSRQTLESAASFCLTKTHFYLEIEHLLMKLLDTTGSDAQCILRYFDVDKNRLTSELTRSLDNLKTGNTRNPLFSPTALKLLTEAWVVGSLDFGSGQIRTGYMLLALTSNEDLLRIVRALSKELQKINADNLKKDFATITAASREVAWVLAVAPQAATGSKP